MSSNRSQRGVKLEGGRGVPGPGPGGGMQEKGIGDRASKPAGDPPAITTSDDEICRCGHELMWHRHADDCRFEDCTCREFYGYDPEPQEDAPFSGEPFDPNDPNDTLYGRRDGRNWDGSTNRAGDWPASIGFMPKD